MMFWLVLGVAAQRNSCSYNCSSLNYCPFQQSLQFYDIAYGQYNGIKYKPFEECRDLAYNNGSRVFSWTVELYPPGFCKLESLEDPLLLQYSEYGYKLWEATENCVDCKVCPIGQYNSACLNTSDSYVCKNCTDRSVYDTCKTNTPTNSPSIGPTYIPTRQIFPTIMPISIPTLVPSLIPTIVPSLIPTQLPSLIPTIYRTTTPRGKYKSRRYGRNVWKMSLVFSLCVCGMYVTLAFAHRLINRKYERRRSGKIRQKRVDRQQRTSSIDINIDIKRVVCDTTSEASDSDYDSVTDGGIFCFFR